MEEYKKMGPKQLIKLLKSCESISMLFAETENSKPAGFQMKINEETPLKAGGKRVGSYTTAHVVAFGNYKAANNPFTYVSLHNSPYHYQSFIVLPLIAEIERVVKESREICEQDVRVHCAPAFWGRDYSNGRPYKESRRCTYSIAADTENPKSFDGDCYRFKIDQATIVTVSIGESATAYSMAQWWSLDSYSQSNAAETSGYIFDPYGKEEKR